MQYLEKIGKNSRAAFKDLKTVTHEKIKKVLNDYNKAIFKNKRNILRENQKDVRNIKREHLIDRLILDDKRISNIRNSINEIIHLFFNF